MRERLAELLAADECEPWVLLLRFRLEAEPQRVGVGRHAQLHNLQRALLLGTAHRDVVFRSNRVLRQIALARLQSQQLGVLVRHHFQDDAVQVRQRRAVGRLAPVVRVALQYHALARLVGREYERSQAHYVGRRRLHRPRLGELARAISRLQLVPRHDGQRVQHPQPLTRWAGKAHPNGARVHDGSGNRLSTGDQVRCECADLPVGSLPLTENATSSAARGVPSDHFSPSRRYSVWDQAVGARVPALCQPRLELERGPVHPHQAGLGESAEEVSRLGADGDAVEGPGFGPDGGYQLTAPARGPRVRHPSASSDPPDGSTTGLPPPAKQWSRRLRSGKSGPFVATPAHFLAGPEPVKK